MINSIHFLKFKFKLKLLKTYFRSKFLNLKKIEKIMIIFYLKTIILLFNILRFLKRKKNY